jgi:hypothetical protein
MTMQKREKVFFAFSLNLIRLNPQVLPSEIEEWRTDPSTAPTEIKSKK